MSPWALTNTENLHITCNRISESRVSDMLVREALKNILQNQGHWSNWVVGCPNISLPSMDNTGERNKKRRCCLEYFTWFHSIRSHRCLNEKPFFPIRSALLGSNKVWITQFFSLEFRDILDQILLHLHFCLSSILNSNPFLKPNTTTLSLARLSLSFFK